jgi:hypothetical protein
LEAVRQLERTIQTGKMEKEIFTTIKKVEDENIYGQNEEEEK